MILQLPIQHIADQPWIELQKMNGITIEQVAIVMNGHQIMKMLVVLKMMNMMMIAVQLLMKVDAVMDMSIR